MFASKSVKVCLSAYYEARRIFHEKFYREIGWMKFTDLIFRFGLEKLKTLSKDEILQCVRELKTN
ncbi:MAG: hypothetical protein QXX51_01345 [Candidatus Bathyarchaeia archaeon]